MSESGQVFAAVFYCPVVFCIHLPEIELSHKLRDNAIKVSILFGGLSRSFPGISEPNEATLQVREDGMRIGAFKSETTKGGDSRLVWQ